MKMIAAVVNKRDAAFVCDALRDNRVPFTEVSSSGGFLRAGNTTLFIGTEDERVPDVIELIRTYCSQRMQSSPYALTDSMVHTAASNSAKVLVGGATVFVANVEHFERL